MPATTPERSILGPNVQVRYLYAPGELEGSIQRATDPVWSLYTHSIHNVVHKTVSPSMYYIIGAPARGFVREKLQVIPADTELPPKKFKSYSYVHMLTSLFHPPLSIV